MRAGSTATSSLSQTKAEQLPSATQLDDQPNHHHHAHPPPKTPNHNLLQHLLPAPRRNASNRPNEPRHPAKRLSLPPRHNPQPCPRLLHLGGVFHAQTEGEEGRVAGETEEEGGVE